MVHLRLVWLLFRSIEKVAIRRQRSCGGELVSFSRIQVCQCVPERERLE